MSGRGSDSTGEAGGAGVDVECLGLVRGVYIGRKRGREA